MLTKTEQAFLDEISNPSLITYNSVAKNISLMINSFSFHRDRLADEILSNQNAVKNFDSIASVWTINQASDYTNKYFDGRNELSCKTAALLLKNEPVNSWFKEKADETGQNICYCLMNMHKTLKQTFSSLCFSYLVKRWENDVPQIISSFQEMDYKWWDMPLI